jgi:hypothetical protein
MQNENKLKFNIIGFFGKEHVYKWMDDDWQPEPEKIQVWTVHTSYSDSLDDLRLSLKGYNIK